MEHVIEFLRQGETPLAYVVLFLAAGLEYVFPPLPGDAITLLGVFLAITAGYRGLLVYLAVTAGAIAGGLVAWAFGRWLGRAEDRWPRFMRRPRIRASIHTLCERFDRHGAAYLAINRFVPAFRAFFFVTAGMTRMHPAKVALFGGISAAAWNGLIFAAGWALGNNYGALARLVHQYTWGALAVIGLVLLVLIARALVRRRHGTEP